MDLFAAIAEVVEADDLMPGDMILSGDEAVGIAAFVELNVVLVQDNGTLLVRTAGRKEFVLKPTTQVVRIVQGVNP